MLSRWVFLVMLATSSMASSDYPGEFFPLLEADLIEIEKSLGVDIPGRDFHRLEGYEVDLYGERRKYVYAVSNAQLYSRNICRYFRVPLEIEVNKGGQYSAKLLGVDEADNFAAYIEDEPSRVDRNNICDLSNQDINFFVVKNVSDADLVEVFESIDKIISQGQDYARKYRTLMAGWVGNNEELNIVSDQVTGIYLSEFYYQKSLSEGFHSSVDDLLQESVVPTVSLIIEFHDENETIYGISVIKNDDGFRVVRVGVGTFDRAPIKKMYGLESW